jgi:hypothetical protein
MMTWVACEHGKPVGERDHDAVPGSAAINVIDLMAALRRSIAEDDKAKLEPVPHPEKSKSTKAAAPKASRKRASWTMAVRVDQADRSIEGALVALSRAFYLLGLSEGKDIVQHARWCGRWIPQAPAPARHGPLLGSRLQVPELRLIGLLHPLLPAALWRRWIGAANFADKRHLQLRVAWCLW